jgi:hypothetical protein
MKKALSNLFNQKALPNCSLSLTKAHSESKPLENAKPTLSSNEALSVCKHS